MVDIEDIDGDATDRSAAYEIGTFPVKMSVPFVTARIEKGSELAVNESLPPMSEPLKELQWKQLSARLLATVGPWCFFEMMWSISKGVSSNSRDIWQYSQRFRARCHTIRARAASMRCLTWSAFLHLDVQDTAGSGFEDGK